MDRCKRLLPLIMVLLTIPVVSNDNNRSSMPYREALSEEVKFWKQVFARISTNQHVIHDSQHLSVIYKIVSYDSNTSPRFRQRRIRAIKDEIEDLLLKFHRGQFEESRLTSWEREIYDQFKSIRESNKFLKASRRIRSQQGIREKFIKGLQRSFAYLPYIEKIFEEKGLPKELVYLPHVESSFNLYARSKVGAAGMWQFMRSTARSLMKVNWIIDQRIDPIVATKGAARILDYNYYVLRDWALAITAYNHGLNSMKRAKRRFGADYLKIRERYLRRSFGFASKNFYPEFLAVVEIMDSVDYFFPNVEKDSLLVFREIKLPTAISLPYFARKYGLDIDQLKKLNPAYRWKTWSGARRVPAGYSLRIPLNANAERILLSSGASIEDLREIEVARKDPVHGVLVLETIKERLARREAVQQALATTRPGIETGQLLMEDVAYLDEAHFALFEEQAEGSIVFEDAPTPNLSPQEMALAVLPKQSLELADNLGIFAINTSLSASEGFLPFQETIEQNEVISEEPEPSVKLAMNLSKPVVESEVAWHEIDTNLFETSRAGESHQLIALAGELNLNLPSTDIISQNLPVDVSIQSIDIAEMADQFPIAEQATQLTMSDYYRDEVFPAKSKVEPEFATDNNSSFSGKSVQAMIAYASSAVQEENVLNGSESSERIIATVINHLKPGLEATSNQTVTSPIIPENILANAMESKGYDLLSSTARFVQNDNSLLVTAAQLPKQTIQPVKEEISVPSTSLTEVVAYESERQLPKISKEIHLAHSKPFVTSTTLATEDVLATSSPDEYITANEPFRDLLLAENSPVSHQFQQGFKSIRLAKAKVESITPDFVVARSTQMPVQNIASDSKPVLFASSSNISFRKKGVENSFNPDYVAGQQLLAGSGGQILSTREIQMILMERLRPENGSVIVYPRETLGHYSEWLNISIYQLRRINNISRRQQLYTGQRLKLTFTRASAAEFFEMRLNYHMELLRQYLNGASRLRLINYRVNPGENVWNLAHKRYNFPVNLLLYFNDLDKLEHLYPGDIIKLPDTFN